MKKKLSKEHSTYLQYKNNALVDLLKYLENSGSRLPDAQIKSELGEEHGKALLHENWDFIARLFLESYYREE